MAHIRQHLDNVTSGASDRLMLFVPPRHGKSEMVTVRYPVWRLEREPELRVIIGAYNQMLANTFSRKARRIAERRLSLTDDRTAVEQWETTAGGGLRAVGVGAGITGQGGNLIVIDDPVKSREEAESETYRERVWQWYTDDLYTRLEPGGAIILIMTRWHEDDLAGRILASEDGPRWTVVNLPAEAEEDDPLGREIGAPLCPERFDSAALADIRRVLGTRSYTALYQQRPQPPEGDLLKREWFTRFVDEAPGAGVAARVRYWDMGATEGGGDYTVGLRMSVTSGGIYTIEDVVRGQWSSQRRDAVVRQTAEMDGRQCYVQREEEPGSSGKDASAAFVRLLAGFPVLPAERVTGDKAVRAGPFAAQAEAGNVVMVRGAWNRAYIEELAAFPTGTHDDQVDTSSGAFNTLASKVRRPLAPTQVQIRRR